LAQNPPPLQAVPVLDVARYAGKWFEIDRLPNSAQRDRVGSVTARYRQLPDGVSRAWVLIHPS
jgi:apolipoprotein D and lipocalin family protein